MTEPIHKQNTLRIMQIILTNDSSLTLLIFKLKEKGTSFVF